MVKTKLNLKTVKQLFDRGMVVDNGVPVAVRAIIGRVFGAVTRDVGSITRRDYDELTPHQLKHKVISVREEMQHEAGDTDRMYLHVQDCGGLYTLWLPL